ncbi:6657_t:CDS:2 [Funneliformis mosseae]|uniref:6657_t:CDS:1 n=1 Tax=Funneliformis mosseae TaxID=27381 RepID=A0A9N9GY93_FUNMO|nr:6657_t:CDS:2 [Funneliformis mosseae]
MLDPFLKTRRHLQSHIDSIKAVVFMIKSENELTMVPSRRKAKNQQIDYGFSIQLINKVSFHLSEFIHQYLSSMFMKIGDCQHYHTRLGGRTPRILLFVHLTMKQKLRNKNSPFAGLVIRVVINLLNILKRWLTCLSSKYKIGNDGLNPNTKRAISSAIQDADPRPSISR